MQQSNPTPVSELQLKLISLLIDHATLIEEQDVQKLGELLTSSDLRAIFDVILRMVDRQGSLDVTALLDELHDNQFRPWLEAKLALQEHSLEGAREAFEEGLVLLERKSIEQQLPRLQERIVEARRTGDDALAAGLTREFVELTRSAHRLKANTKQR